MNIKKNILLYTTIPLLILLASSAYYRFVVLHDYLVAYEGECDPYTESCYVYCEDDACTEPFYYSIIERNASEVFNLCGADVTVCDEAYECQPEVEYCEIYYCDTELDGENACEILYEGDKLDTKEESLDLTLPTTATNTSDVDLNYASDTTKVELVNPQEL